MNGVRSEPVEVWMVNERPARFVWRERLYTVLSVIDSPADPAPGQEWRCWRVRASAGRNMPGSFYRLCQSSASGRWQLSRNGR
jgi:hypothetical protein